MKRCYKCGWEWPAGKKRPGHAEACPKCTAYLHCCMNCRHHDPALHNECRVPGTDMIADRRRMNYCDAFDFTDTDEEAVAAPEKQDQARAAFTKLFGDESGATATGQAARDFLGPPKARKDPKRALDDLFGG